MTSTTNTSTTAPKVTPAEHITALTALVVPMVTGEGTVDATAIATYLRAVPAPSRGSVQAGTLSNLFGTEGVDFAKVGKVNEAFDNVKDLAPSATRTKVTVNPLDTLAMQAAVSRYVADAITYHAATLDGYDEEAFAEMVGKVDHGKMVQAGNVILDRLAKSDRGTRTTIEGTIEEMVAAGTLKAGTALTGGGNAKGTIDAKGIKVSGKVYGNPTAAAVAAGAKGAVNGWKFWTITEGDAKVTIGSKR